MRPPPLPLCLRCGVPIGPARVLCAPCAVQPPRYASARAAGLFRDSEAPQAPLAVAIRAFKYAGRRRLGAALGELLAERYPFGPDALLVPVPLHRSRLRARGFNQAWLLAAELGRRRGLVTMPDVLVRTRATGSQPGLPAEARQRNLAGAFAVRRADAVRGCAVVLIDDVLTTGATADACAAALLATDVSRVDVFTVARVP